MNLQQRFYTEAKAHSHSNTLYNLKPDPHSLNEQEFSKGDAYPMLKYLTVKIHEANLFVDVSILGKMTTFAQVQLGTLTWKTSVDKDLNMKPKWNESKTFEVKNLGKYFKNFHKNSASVSNNEFTSHNDLKSGYGVDPGIIVGVYDHSFFHDMLIGEIRISLRDILNTKPTGEYYIHNNNQMVGSIKITHKFEYGEEDLGTNFTQEPMSSIFKSESKFQTGSHGRVATEPTETAKSAIYRTNLINHRNFPSNFSAQPSDYESAGPSLQRIGGYQSADMGRNYQQQFGKMSQRPESNELAKANNKRTLNAYKRKSEEKDYETLVTYENYNEYGSELDEEERQAYNDFFNSPSSEGRTESSQEDLSDGGMGLEDYEGMRKGSIEDDLSYEGLEPAVMLQKHLEAIKRINYNLQSLRNVVNLKAAESREVYERYVKGKRAIKAKQNDLMTREECLVNEKKNLETDIASLQQQEEKLREYRKGVLEHKAMLKQALKNEKEENERKVQLEGEIRQLSMSYQRETAGLKKMEHDMYKKLIAQKTEDLKRELEVVAVEDNDIEQNQNENVGNVPEFGRDADDEKEGVEQVGLQQLVDHRSGLENEIEEKIKNIERLREILRARIADEEN